MNQGGLEPSPNHDHVHGVEVSERLTDDGVAQFGEHSLGSSASGHFFSSLSLLNQLGELVRRVRILKGSGVFIGHVEHLSKCPLVGGVASSVLGIVQGSSRQHQGHTRAQSGII